MLSNEYSKYQNITFSDEMESILSVASPSFMLQ